MIKNPQNTKDFCFGFTHTSNAEVIQAQVFVDDESVVIAYLGDRGRVLDADWFAKAENPELNNIVRTEPHADVWDFETILSLVEPVNPNERLAMEECVPAYLQSLQAAS